MSRLGSAVYKGSIVKKSDSEFIRSDVKDWQRHLENNYFHLPLLKLFLQLLNEVFSHKAKMQKYFGFVLVT